MTWLVLFQVNSPTPCSLMIAQIIPKSPGLSVMTPCGSCCFTCSTWSPAVCSWRFSVAATTSSFEDLRTFDTRNTLKTSMCFWMAPHLVTFYLILSVTNSLILITVSSIHFLFCCCHKVRNSFSCCHKMICWNDVILHTNNANAWKILVSQIGSHFVICNDTSPNQHYLMMMPQPMFNVKMCWASSITSTCM